VKRIPVPLGADGVRLLRVGIAGRKGHEPLFTRWGYRRSAQGGLKWERHQRHPWGHAELSTPFRAIATAAHLSADVTAYALRHSSIVRNLGAGLPIRLVGSLHDTSSEMIEAHNSATSQPHSMHWPQRILFNW